MPKRADDLSLEALGNLANYDHDELAQLREKCIDDLARIDQEGRHHDRKIKEHNQAKNDLMHTRAQRGKALRALKHELSLRGTPGERRTTLVARGRLRA